jgi:manganese transport protein
MRKIFAYIGPAFITAALVFGPGSIVTASSIGASFGYSLLWVAILTFIFMVVYTDIGVRIGIASQASPIQVIKDKWGRLVGVLVGIGGFLVATSFQAGNSVGVGVAANVMFSGNTALWAGIFTAIAIALLWFPNYYKSLERLMIGLIGLMLITFLITAIVARPEGGALVRGFVPNIPEGAGLLIIALIGTTFSVVAAFYQGYLVQEKGWREDEYEQGAADALSGIIVLSLITILVMVAAAAVLLPQGVSVASPADLAVTLEPAVGTWASVVFALGIFGAAFSSLIGNATLGGALISDAFELGHQLDSIKVKVAITLVMLLGGIIAVVFAAVPIQMLIFAQAITILVVPFIGLLMLWLASDRTRMGSLVNPAWKTVLGIVGFLALLATAVRLIIVLFT